MRHDSSALLRDLRVWVSSRLLSSAAAAALLQAAVPRDSRRYPSLGQPQQVERTGERRVASEWRRAPSRGLGGRREGN